MLIDVTLTRPARYDGFDWEQLRIESATDPAGPWTDVTTLDLDPSPDPTYPLNESFTLDVIDPDAYLRAVYLSNVGLDESAPIALPYAVTVADIAPSVADVAGLIPARVSEEGNGTFTAGTTPSATQVQSLIDRRAGEIYSRCERIGLRHVPLAKEVVALAVALEVERGFFPQEQDNSASILDDLRADFNVKISRLEGLTRLAWVSRVP